MPRPNDRQQTRPAAPTRSRAAVARGAAGGLAGARRPSRANAHGTGRANAGRESPGLVGPSSGRAGRRAEGRRRRRRRAVTALSLVTVVLFGAVYCAVQLLRPLPPATATVVLPAHLVFAEQPGGRGVALPLPAAGAADVEVEGLGQLGGVRQDAVLPLASVTKLMTALLVLKDHPLAPGEQGPAITVTAAEASAYRAELAAGDSVAAVETGEQLTELQALEALLVPSADNVADILAIWDAGSVPAFVHKMNAEAAKLGLGHTHYADTSGLDPASAGTAADMVRLAGYVMADPVLRQIVSLPEVTLPVAGTVSNYDTALGHDGIVGIKTGNTPQAGGNFVFASKKLVQGRTFTVVGAVFDQGGRQPLQAALDEAERLSAAALSRIHEVTVLPAGTKVIQLKALWGAATTAVTGEAVRAIGIPGESARAAVELLPETARLHHARAGERLGSVEVSFPDGAASVPVVTTAPLGRAPLTWRLSRL